MKRKILLIHTGGTIGMIKDLESGVLKPDLFYKSLVNMVPELYDIADIQVEIPFVMDSSELHIPQWQEMARIIKGRIDAIDGVVITHGTDTMAYTASALSYMLMNVPVPVILTGAQKPLSELRTDARTNIVNAVELAAASPLKEVAIFFDDRLMRGNRTIKIHINHFDAFMSPNFPLLAKVGINIDIFGKNLLSPGGLFHVFEKMDPAIAVYKSFPGCGLDYFQPHESTRAVFLMGYGAGTFALGVCNLLERVDEWLDQGKLVVLMSETRAGALEPQLYESGSQLLDRGALHTGDMTFPAGITKMMFLLGQYSDNAIIKKNFQKNLAGELSV